MENNRRILYKIKHLERELMRKSVADEFEKPENFEAIPHPTPTQIQIMEYVLENDKDVYQRDLENILKVKRATVSGVLQTMEKNGLIERIIDSEDTRTKRIVVKEPARIIFERNKKKFDKFEKNIVKGISEEDLEIFMRVLDTMQKNLES